MTTPHPTPEERVEATLNDWRKDAGDLRVHFATAIREAEAAGEARGRVMEREECARLCDAQAQAERKIGGFGSACSTAANMIRARSDKESSDV